ncbi:uncharacterized protein LOC135502416 [Lineus longissimus]|uniref:uncharacterized protein LOC135502416 n=1 Tax=Lineus longissimus TaxID=88925 RepID=UPI002B4F7584
MAGHKPTFLERKRALDIAKNPIRSKFGDQILRNSDDSRLLISRIEKIDKYFKRAQRAIENDKKRFLDSREMNKIEPTIIVERGPSVETLLRHHYGEAAMSREGPRYMKNTASTYKSPSVLPTIDMFVVKKKRKKNTWEDASPEKLEHPVFHSVIPAGRLSDDEKKVLHRGWSFHQEASDRGAKEAQKVNREKSLDHLPRDIRSAIGRVKGVDYVQLEVADNNRRSEDQDDSKCTSSAVFVTQLYRRDSEELPKAPLETSKQGEARFEQKGLSSKSVKFSEDIEVQEFDRKGAVTAGSAKMLKRRVGRIEISDKKDETLPPIHPNKFADVKPRYNNHALAGSETIAVLHSSVRKPDQERQTSARSGRQGSPRSSRVTPSERSSFVSPPAVRVLEASPT